ncbi:YhdP family protein [Rhabdochromatium marinum]|uniref:YhdP family protein n=1 Tax=Rhabdochromatium marinum TaxID=48729 RepID=UPI00190812F8|nr:YhdP family protein [Rhabdochromatium marinum]MBK1648372.1 TIGR02099 family protein [Rhabdochromatium marinum]
MKHLALTAVLHTRRVLMILLLMLAGLLLLVRALGPSLVEGLRDELAVYVGDWLDMQITVRDLTLHLDGWSPHLTLTDVTLTDRVNDQAELSARALQLDLNFLASLMARHPRIEGLSLVGADLELHRTTEGQIEISGLQALSGGQDPGALAFFLRDGSFALSDSRLYWSDSFTGATTVALDIEHLQLVNHQDRHQLRLDARLASEPGGRVRILGRLQGAAADMNAWSGQLYAQVTSHGDLARLLPDAGPETLHLELPGLRFESWWRFAAGQPQDLLARVRLDALRAYHGRPEDAPAALTLEGLSLLAHWSRKGEESHVRIANLRAQGLGSEPLSLSLSLRPKPAAMSPSAATTAPPTQRLLLGGCGDIELAVLQRLAQLAPPQWRAAWPVQLSQQSLAGRLERLVFALTLPATGFSPTDWRVKAELDDIGLAQQGSWPGVQGLNLEFDARPKHGFARLSAREGGMDLRPHLPSSTPVKQLFAEAGWRIEPAGSLHIQLPYAQLQTPDLSAALRAELCLHRSASPYVNLHLQIRDLEARAAARYLPVRVLNPSLVAWLQRALQGGRMTTGDLLLRGRLADFPFDDQQGRFLMDLEIEDGILDYSAPRDSTRQQPRWPALTELDAEVRIVNRRLDIHARRGQFLHSELRQGSAELPNLWHAKRILISAQGEGPFSDGRRVLLDTPLEAQLGRLARALEVDGQLGVELNLSVPFRRGDPIDYQGALHWEAGPETAAQARLMLGEGLAPLELRDIQGQLDFSKQGVQAQGIQAQLGGQPIRIDVDTEASAAGEAGGYTLVQAQGQTPLAQLVDSFPSPAWRLVHGDPRWTCSIRLSNRNFSSASTPIELALRSDLRGVSLEVPAPLGKAAARSLPLRLSAQLVEQQVRDPLVQLGPLQARLAFSPVAGQAPALRGAAIALNASPPPPPQTRALSLSGHLDRLDLGAWLDWWREQRKHLAASGQPWPLHAKGVGIDQLRLGALKFNQLQAALAPTTDGGLRVSFEASDNAGTLSLPPAGSAAPMQLQLAHWRLTDADSVTLATPGTVPQRSERQAPDPRRLGPLDIHIDQLDWRQHPLGAFAVRLVPQAAGLALQEIRLNGPQLEVRGQGRWQVAATERGAPGATTAVNLELSSPNAGDLLRDLKLYRGLDGSRAQVSAQLDWPGDPGAFGLAKAAGTLQVEFGPGQLLNLEPGVGRMLGILNIAAIQRRLNLDFSELVDEGLTFDRASGAFAVGAGVARIKHFELLSSTADLRITGITHLVEQTLDQTVTVTPKISTGVALASAVAGGPLVGAAVFLADKVAGDAMDRLTQYQYRVTGPWSKPDIERLGMTINDMPAQTPRPTKSKPKPKPEPDNLFLEHF